MFFNREQTQRAAEKCAQQGKFSAAIDEYKRILQQDPRDVTILNTVGDLYVRTGQVADGIAYFARVAQAYADEGAAPRAVAVYKKILKLEPGDRDTALKLAETYVALGQSAEARRQYLELAESYRKTDQPRQALRALRKAADLTPDDVRLARELGDAYAAEGMTDDAVEVLVNAGLGLTRRGHAAKSAELFERALALRPGVPDAVRGLSQAYVEAGDVAGAVRLLDGILSRRPDDIESLAILARVYVDGGQLADAEVVVGRVAALDPERLEPLLELAGRSVERGDHDRAVRVIAAAIGPLLAGNEKKGATAVLKNVLAKAPDHLDALTLLADIYDRAGERRNLAATLAVLSESALRQGRKDLATRALKQLVAVEPAKQAHQRRLERLAGAPPAPEPSSPDRPDGFEPKPALSEWTRALAAGEANFPAADEPSRAASRAAGAGEVPFGWGFEGVEIEIERPGRLGGGDDEETASFSDASTELLESMIATRPEFLQARVKLLEELVAQQPGYIEGRQTLKGHYLDSGLHEKASAQCVEIARLFEARGDTAKAREFVAEAYELNPSLTSMMGAASAAAAAEPAVALRSFDAEYEREYRRAARDSGMLSIIRLAVDGFGEYAEANGELGADYCLERVAGALQEGLHRPADTLTRVQGHEFAVILPDTDATGAAAVANRLRDRVEGLRIASDPAAPGRCVTVSAGVAGMVATISVAPQALVAAANRALFRAREAGGNTVASAPLSGES